MYYRLNLIEIAVPALAERTDDILPLAEHFLGLSVQMDDEARNALLRHAWPGNVRELRNSIERAKLLVTENIIRVADLNLPVSTQVAVDGSEGSELTRADIETGLRIAGGNISRTAQSLGISRQALYRRMERFGLRT